MYLKDLKNTKIIKIKTKSLPIYFTAQYQDLYRLILYKKINDKLNIIIIIRQDILKKNIKDLNEIKIKNLYPKKSNLLPVKKRSE